MTQMPEHNNDIPHVIENYEISKYVSNGSVFCIFQLGPNVTIGRNVTLGEGVRVRESMILEGSTIQVCTCSLTKQI